MISERMRNLPTHYSSWLGDVGNDLARKGKDVIGLAGNALISKAPKHVLAAVKKAIDEGLTDYAPNRGLFSLREAIAQKMKRVDRIEIGPENQIIVTSGAQEAVYLAVMSLLNPGEEAIGLRPDYPFNYHVRLAGGKIVQIPLEKNRGFPLEAEAFEKAVTPKTRMICLDDPHNPTGRVFTKEELESVAEVAKKHDLWVVFDSANERLLWDGHKNVNIGSLSGMGERTLMTSSVSKSYGMGGFRVGYAAGPKEVIANMGKLHTVVNNVGPSTFAQKGAEALYRGPEVPRPAVLRSLEQTRNRVVKRFNEMKKISCHSPESGGVVIPEISGLGMSSLELAQLILKRVYVATGAGLAYSGDQYLRINFTHPRINEAIERIVAVIEKL